MNYIKPVMNEQLLEVKLKYYLKECGEMTYDECLEIATQAEGFLKDLSPFDIAFTLFAKQRDEFYKYAELLALIHQLPRLEHLVQYPVTYSHGDEVHEAIVCLPKHGPRRRERQLVEREVSVILTNHHSWFNTRHTLEVVIGEQLVA